MAKQNKSGLGRGLNSLISGSFEEAGTSRRDTVQERNQESTQEKSQERTQNRVRVDEDKEVPSKSAQQATHRQTASKQVNTKASKGNSGGSLSEMSRQTQREDTSDASALGEDYEYIDNEDNITIKSVVERAVQNRLEGKSQSNDRRGRSKEDNQQGGRLFGEEVDISLIEPNPDQPRTLFKKEEIEELASSIEENGLLQPILVRAMASGKYQIIAGERRWQACCYLKLKTVPVRIKEADDDKALELALIENIQRSDLNPIEEAYGYRRLMERRHLTQSEVAQAVSKGRSTIANALRLLELPEEAQQLLFEEKISAGHARAILSIPTKEGRQKLTDRMLKEKLSVREAESLARLYSMNQKESNKEASQTTALKTFKSVARALRSSLGTNVRVKTVRGKNKIEIEFKDEEELKRLFEEITAFQKDKNVEIAETAIDKTDIDELEAEAE